MSGHRWHSWAALVFAALESSEELDQFLADGNGAAQKASADQAPTQDPIEAPKPPRTAFLRRLTAQGFRGIGPEATLDLTPGPGLTLVVGRNGSGKSSFAEGLELLLTGDTYRWSQRSKVWRDGWRNLHHPKAALAAEFALERETGACTGQNDPCPLLFPGSAFLPWGVAVASTVGEMRQ